MKSILRIDEFIKQFITERDNSLFKEDLSSFHTELEKKITDKNVLVIGGAGTIGSSYIKALLRFKVKKLVVVDINENGLTELVRDLRSSDDLFVPVDIKTYPINFSDSVFEKIFKKEGPFHIVANFAAHKHVRSEKDQFSIEAMIENNVIKAKKLLDLLLDSPPEHFFCVSTDKAANPVNVMGASKKLMEDVILAYSAKMPITTARFANVAFSNGSLPFGFIERLMKKQPLSSPSNIRRYFVSPQESGELCLLACILGKSGEIFFPKLNEKDMKTFSEIAVKLLETLGYQADFCSTEDEARKKALVLDSQSTHYPVYFFESDTSGEKPYEEFYTENEMKDMNTFAQLGVIKDAQRKEISEIEETFSVLMQLFENDEITKADIVEALKIYLPNFEHIEKGKSLDQRM
ncbi:SDR family NAD(P)-dependent oxidoreductase [Solitalea lacus]|uniref:SDR family NAD(P)-dependent oxidoreductase n=1 Tax=Solitalea lacus TaxID=2911172 RepID=UPI001EDA2DB4|nr:SDR family NAD(P)-dependent oxidoreductase [Solitalea lacus]UKJ08260.1 SDR family NAD(P)-dependent oxidoreductase [Solitalea lacus]